MTADNMEDLDKAAKKVKRGRKLKERKPPPEMNPDLPTIRLGGGKIEQTVDTIERALIRAERNVYQRANMIVGVGHEGVLNANETNMRRLGIVPIGERRLQELITSAANFEKVDVRSGDVFLTDAPLALVQALMQRVGHYRLPVLSGIIGAPTLRADGSLLTGAGYDRLTGLYFDPAGETFPPIPERPSQAAAAKALAILADLIATFPFVGEADRSVALSAILTGVVRRSLRTAPMHAFTAPVAGSGKSKLVDIACVVVTGHEAEVIALGKDEAETEKRLGALLISGSPITIDNVETGVGGDILCQILTQTSVKVRILGLSQTPMLPTNVLVTATGNNITLVGDMTRRAVLCRLDPKTERPELREFTFEPVERAKVERGRLLAAALTILRAYHVAGRPPQTKRLGSFEDWSDLVRGSLVWLGCADPVETMEQSRAHDPKLESLRAVMVQWSTVIRAEKMTANEIATRASQQRTAYAGEKATFTHPEFREALMMVAGSGGFIDPVRLGKWLGRNKGRVVDGMRLEPASIHAGITKWQLQGGAVRAIDLADDGWTPDSRSAAA